MLSLILQPAFLIAESGGDQIRLERPLGVEELGGCALFRGVLRLPHSYTQAQDGRIVIEAEDAATSNIAAEGAVGPFASTEQNLIGTDRRASLERYVSFARGAQWERAQWNLAVAKPCKLISWHRIFVMDPGEYTHTESLNGKGGGEQIVTFKSSDPNSKSLHRWQWAKGREHDFVAGANVFVIAWHNGARLDQIAFLPEGVQPQGSETLLPTFDKTVPSATAVTKPVKLGPGERAGRLLSQTDLAGGQVDWEISADRGKTWRPVQADGVLPGLRATGGQASATMKDAESLMFRVKLTESPGHASPLVQGVCLEVSKPRPVVELQTVPVAMQFRETSIPLIPATWSGLRWLGPEQSAGGGASNGRGGAWALMNAVQPDAQGILWMNAAESDFIDLLPSCRSWMADVPGSVSGKAIRQGLWNRNVISFDVSVPRKDKYRPWFRVQLARDEIRPDYHPTVSYQFDRQPIQRVEIKELGKDYPGEAFRKKEWVWLPGKEIELEAGVQTFRLRAGLDYTWLDRVCLAPAGATAPQGQGGASTRLTVPSATVTFQPLCRAMAKSWQEIQTESQAKGGRATYSFSRDGGKTWTELKGGSLQDLPGGEEATSSDLILQCALRPDAEGNVPRIIEWKAVAKEAAEPLIQLANKEQKIIFDPASGDLLGWWSARAGLPVRDRTQTGWMIPLGRRQPLFELGLPQGVGKPDPQKLQRREITNKGGAGALSLKYLLEGGTIAVEVRVELPEKGLARWKMIVENSSPHQVCGLNFPVIGGLRIGNDAESNRAPFVDAFTGEGSGALFDFLAQHNPSSGIYPGWTSMGWYTLFSPRGGGAFTLQTRNKDACHIWMTQKKDPSAVAMEYKFSRMLVVEPDAAGEAEYEIGWHDGDWHQSAELYRTWMNSWMQKLPTPNWVRHADGWFDAGQGIAARYMTHGWPKMEWFGASFSGNFGRAMDGTISCTDFPFVNPRLGTAAEFRKAHAAAREKGWHSVYYWNWMAWNDAFADASHIGPTPRALLPPDIRLRPRGFVEEYGTRDSSGKLEPCIGLGMSAFEFAGDYVMCSGSTGWKDMLVDGMAHNYGAALGADGVYLDQSGLAAQFCASTGHGHGSQQAVAGVGMSEVFKRSVEQGRLKNPDFALAIEGNCDRYMQSASFGLWLSSPYWDGNVFQYVFPDAKLLRGHHNGGGLSVTIGEYARYLNLFLTGDLAGNFHELKEFYAHRKRIGDWMHNGVFQDDVGLSVSKPGIEAKWFKRNEKEHLGACVNIHNEESISGAMLRLRWSKLKGTPVAFAYLWGGELKTTPVQWEDDAAVIAVPTAQASTLLVIAEAPRNESIRAHGYWPLASGPDKLILVLANISGRSRTATLSYQSPDSVTLRDPPRALKVPAREVVRQEIPMSGIARMLSRGNLEVRIQEGGWFRKTTKQIACSLAPPLVNGSFETDSAGNGTPDLWAAWGVEILTQLLQLKEFPPIVQNDKGVIHHADGFMDPTNAAEGKYGLLLPGRLMLPYTWCRKPSDPSPIPNQPFFFKTGQQLILKPATRYRLGFQHKQEAEDGMLEMTAEVCEWPYRPPPAFPPQKIPAAKENRRWTPFSYEFETNKDLEGTPDLQIANKSAGKAWIDAVEIRELGGAETN